jgi:hypothetical protein
MNRSRPARSSSPAIGILLLLLAALAALAGAWAFIAPRAFFDAVASDTGSFNGHLMRDVGSAFLAASLALLLAWRLPASRLPLLAVAATFLVLHAVAHVWDISTGALPAAHWHQDLPGVFAPALLALGLFGWVAVTRRREDAS